jgi:hypothetical protein
MYINPMNAEDIKILKLSAQVGQTYRECVAANEPCVIKGLFDVLPGLRQWDLETARARIEEKDLAVIVTPKQSDRISGNTTRQMMATSAYFEKISERDAPTADHYYLAMQSVEKVLPELKPYIEFDTLLPEGLVKSTNFWLGPGSTRVCLHIDSYDNFFMQLTGSKTFYLYAPSDRKYLYVNSPFRASPEESRIDPTNIDHERFPLTSKARLIKVTLNAGDMLFLPIYWWHAVVGGSDVTMSINLWCKGRTFSSWDGASQLMPRRVMETCHERLSNLFKR